MKRLVLILSLLTGCDSSPSGPGLRYRNFGMSGSGFPFIFALQLVNDSSEPITVVDVAPKVTHNYLIVDPEDADKVPPRFTASVVMLDEFGQPIQAGQGYIIAPGKRVNLPCEFIWYTGDNPPQMVAVVRAKFVVSYLDRGKLEVKPFVVVLQSTEGALKATAAMNDPKLAAAHLARLQSIEGEKTDVFDRLVELLSKSARPSK